MQTGASALLAASSIATLYGLVHFFDLFRSAPAVAVEPQRIDFAPDGQADLSTAMDVVEPVELVEVASAPVELQPLADISVEEPEVVEPAAAPASGGRKPRTSRKNSASRAAAPKKAKAAEAGVTEGAKIAGPTLAEVAEVAGTVILEPAAPVPHAPLFEPEPFARMPRQAFGRRGRL